MKCERFSFILDKNVRTVADGYLIISDDEILLTYHTYGKICTRRYDNLIEMAEDIIIFKDKAETLEVCLAEETERANQLEELLDEIEETELLEDEE